MSAKRGTTMPPSATIETATTAATCRVASGVTFCTARWLCLLSLVAIFLTGYVGYFVVDAIWPKFYYEPVTRGKNVWLFMQLVLFALGPVLAFTDIRRASYAAGSVSRKPA